MEKDRFILDGKEFTVRKFTYKKDRTSQIKYLRRFKDYAKEYIGADLYDKFYSSFQTTSLIKSLSEEANSNLSSEDKAKFNAELVQSLLPESISLEFNDKHSEAIQLFLLDNDNNAKELCEMLFENANEIEHNPNDDKFLDYNNFINDVFNYFFFYNHKLKVI